MSWYWPLLNTPPLFPDAPGQFGAIRRYDIHTGIDLYAERDTQVVSVEDGVVVTIKMFTGINADDPSPWWNDTPAVLVEGVSGVVVYGEVSPRVRVGQTVSAGDLIGVVEQPVLKTFKGRPMAMLHLHEQLPGVPTVPYAPPGTVRDNEREIPGPVFNIEGHGFIACLDDNLDIWKGEV